MSKKCKKLIVWSGGLDSTLLLHTLAKESSKENPVEAFSFDVYFVEKLKTVKEKEARENYLKFAKTLGFYINHHIIKVKADINPAPCWPQQKSWFTFILPYISKDCDVYFGYVQGDCIWLAVDNFYKVFADYQYLGDFANSKLIFPFSFKEKWEVLKEFQEEEIPGNCFWTCEHPKKDKRGKIIACTKCHPCIHIEMARQELCYRKEHKCLK